jgi:amino acid transporter
MKTFIYLRLTIIILLCTATNAIAARPSAFNNDLLMLYIGIVLVLLAILGVDHLINFTRKKLMKPTKKPG